MMPLPMHHMHDMPPARSPRRESCRGDALDIAWRATLRAEAARQRCGEAAARPAGRRRRVRGGHLTTQTSPAPKRRPSGGRATGRLAR